MPSFHKAAQKRQILTKIHCYYTAFARMRQEKSAPLPGRGMAAVDWDARLPGDCVCRAEIPCMAGGLTPGGGYACAVYSKAGEKMVYSKKKFEIAY